MLSQRGNIIVGTNDTFDSQFEEGVISEESVQGQLLARTFGGDRNHLDRLIDKSLAGTPSEEDGTKQFGKTRRYPIGTVAVVEFGDARYFLPAFTKMSAGRPPHVNSTIEWLQISLARTWEAISQAGQREPVHLPVIGSHLARLGVSRTLLIQMIVLSFIAADPRRVASHLTVYVNPADENTVDMAVLDEWLRGVCAV